MSEEIKTYLTTINYVFFTTKEAAAYIGCSVNYLNKLRKEGKSPPYLTITNAFVYIKDDIDKWLPQSANLLKRYKITSKDEYLTEKEVAAYIGCSAYYIRKLMNEGEIPCSHEEGGYTIVYNKHEIDKWLSKWAKILKGYRKD